MERGETRPAAFGLLALPRGAAGKERVPRDPTGWALGKGAGTVGLRKP